MIIPSIDLQDGRAVQLIGGVGDPVVDLDPIQVAQEFSILPEVALVDLDAAMSKGSNFELIKEIIRRHPHVRFRVGGGLRDSEAVQQALKAGADKVVIGTAATPEFIESLPRDKVIVALDVGADQRVRTHGWSTTGDVDLKTALSLYDGRVAGILVTHIHREGQMKGVDQQILPLCQGVKGLTIAGGVSTAYEIEQLSVYGDVQLGMCLYTKSVSLGEAFAATLPAEGLIPTIVQEVDGTVLGLVYSTRVSVQRLVDDREGVYHSRRRGLWRKGETSGCTHEVVSITPDCDNDALIVRVRSPKGFCHTGDPSCFGQRAGIARLMRTIQARERAKPATSYTTKLLRDPDLLAAKLVEEAQEVAEAEADVVHEAADLLYHLCVRMVASNVSWEQVMTELDRRGSR